MNESIDEELAAFTRPTALTDRREAAIDRTARQLHPELIRQWATRESGPLPTFADAVAVATAEIDAVCEALGDLSQYAPSQVFRREPRRWPGPEPF